MTSKPLTTQQKQRLIAAHEKGKTARQLALQYGIRTTSVAAYVANAHRGKRT